MSYVTGNQMGPLVNVELTFKNGQTKMEVIKNATPAILETTVYDYQNNDLIASFKLFDAQGKVITLS